MKVVHICRRMITARRKPLLAVYLSRRCLKLPPLKATALVSLSWILEVWLSFSRVRLALKDLYKEWRSNRESAVAGGATMISCLSILSSPLVFISSFFDPSKILLYIFILLIFLPYSSFVSQRKSPGNDHLGSTRIRLQSLTFTRTFRIASSFCRWKDFHFRFL